MGGGIWFAVLLTLGIDGVVWGVAACTAYRALTGPRPRWLGPSLVAGLVFAAWDHWIFRELVHWAGFPRSEDVSWLVETAIQLAATALGFRVGDLLVAAVARRARGAGAAGAEAAIGGSRQSV